MTIIGIDIGSKALLALFSAAGELLEIEDMPILRDGPANRPNVNAPLLASIVYRWQATTAFVEFVSARPGEGPTGAFSFGRSKGVIEGVCAAAGVPVAFITPSSWKRAIGIAPGKTALRTRRAPKQSAAGLDKPACLLASKTTDAPKRR